MSAPLPFVSTAPSTDQGTGQTFFGEVSLLPVSAGDPVWVSQDGSDSDIECYMTDDYIAQVGDRVIFTKVGRVGVLLGKVAPQPGWQALSPTYGTNITDNGSPYDIGAYIKLGSIVYLRGLLRTTGSIATGATLFTMPTGYGMASFDSNGSMFHGGAAISGALSPMRMRLVGYAMKLDNPNPLASGGNFGLTGISYPADI